MAPMPTRRALALDEAGREGNGRGPAKFTPLPVESLGRVLEGLRLLR
ncbi:MAG: hypothetical protein ACTHJW_14180 [Streptosporangiaceae bacterium]